MPVVTDNVSSKGTAENVQTAKAEEPKITSLAANAKADGPKVGEVEEIDVEAIQKENADLKARLADKSTKLDDIHTKFQSLKKEKDKVAQQKADEAVTKEELLKEMESLRQYRVTRESQDEEEFSSWVSSLSAPIRQYADRLQTAGIKDRQTLKTLINETIQKGFFEDKKVTRVDATPPAQSNVNKQRTTEKKPDNVKQVLTKMVS